MTIDLILPIYKPEKNFLTLVDEMASQSLPINRIIIVNTEQKFFDRLIYATKFLDKHKNVEIRHISKREFDHGKTRNAAVKLSNADYFIMMSQNSMPVGKEIVQKLLKAFESDESVAVSYARQVAVESAHEYEKYVRRFYFPEDSVVRSLKDVDTIGWSAYMCSDSCAMYKRSVFDELGGFMNHVIINEDIFFASKAINSGYKVAYVADAVCVYTGENDEKESAKKAFDLAVSVVKHPEIFNANDFKVSLKKMEKMIINHLKRGHRGEIMSFRRLACAKRRGFKKGLKYAKFPRTDIGRFSNNPEYWRADEILRDRNAVDVHAGYGRSAEELKMLSDSPVSNAANSGKE